MISNAKGWLWSEQLQCWLVPEENSLHLYDREHHLCLTEAQAQALLKEQAVEKASEAAERAQEATRRAEEEARRTQEATRRAEEEARRAQAFAEKLRSLGINPDEVA